MSLCSWSPSRCIMQVLGATLLVSLASPVDAQTFSERITQTSDLARPVFVTAPLGDSDRLFIVEQGDTSNGQRTGRIRILDRSTGSLLPTPYLSIPGLSAGNEQGLLGMAFDPDYANNGYIYVNATTSADGGDTHILRYQVAGDPAVSNVIDANSRTEILSFNQPQTNHNGGWIGFGPVDGHLYIASGDGGGGNDDDAGHTAEIGNGQDITNNLLGKMLRIDVNGDDFPSDANRNYSVPSTNPFVNTTGDDEIWSYGLRNPYRSSFDRATGDLWIGDVGQNRKEEINFQAATSQGGDNYGWRLREGTIATPGVGGPAPVDHVEPIFDYEHLSSVEPDPDFRGGVVIGGYVYRGPVAAFQGHYLFSDAASQNIWKLDPDAVDPRASVRRINDLLSADAGSVGGLSSFGEDSDGNLYLMELSGEIFRVSTASKDIFWFGNGTNWSDASNWNPTGITGPGFEAEDHAMFGSDSMQPNVTLDTDQTVSAITFEAPHTLQGNTLRVLSGNIAVGLGTIATIESALEAESTDHSLRKLGSGALVVNGSAGQMVVKQGTLAGDGTFDHVTVSALGTLAPGGSSPIPEETVGAIDVTNTLTLELGSRLEIGIGGTDIGQFDQLFVGGIASLDGTLAVELLDGFVPQAGDSFGFLAATGGGGGMFDTLDLPALGPNLEWLVNPGGITVSLLVNSTLEADFDNDGDVDTDDLNILQTNFGAAGGAGRSQGDSDGDFDVDGADFLRWQQQFTGTAAVGASSSNVVPEPRSVLLLLVSVVAMLTCRVKRPEGV